MTRLLATIRLFGLNGVGLGKGELGLDRDGELGEGGVPDHASELLLGLARASGGQRRHISPFCQCSTLREERRTHSTSDSHGLVDSSVFLSLSVTPRRVTVNASCRPSRSDAAAPGWERSSSEVSVWSCSSAQAWLVSAHALRCR